MILPLKSLSGSRKVRFATPMNSTLSKANYSNVERPLHPTAGPLKQKRPNSNETLCITLVTVGLLHWPTIALAARKTPGNSATVTWLGGPFSVLTRSFSY